MIQEEKTLQNYEQVVWHFELFTQKNDIITKTIHGIASIPFDAEIRQTIMKNLMETPIGPNENVMNIVSTYYQNL